MAKKKTATGNAKKKAAPAADAKIQYEKIVPIPPINVYSELPFQLIESAAKPQTAEHPAPSVDNRSGIAKKRNLAK